MSSTTPCICTCLSDACPSPATAARNASLYIPTGHEQQLPDILLLQARATAPSTAETPSSCRLEQRVPKAAAGTAARRSLTHLCSRRMPTRRPGLRPPVLLLPVCNTSATCCRLVMCARHTSPGGVTMADKRKAVQGAAALLVSRAPFRRTKLLRVSSDSVRQGAAGQPHSRGRWWTLAVGAAVRGDGGDLLVAWRPHRAAQPDTRLCMAHPQQ